MYKARATAIYYLASVEAETRIKSLRYHDNWTSAFPVPQTPMSASMLD